jgi:hypothetical protein
MQKRTVCALLASVATMFAAACERVVELDLPEGAEQLVVEARLERVQVGNGFDTSGVQRIRLTTTDQYFSNTDAPPARGAVVQVVDASGRAVAFSELASTPGTYETRVLSLVTGAAYTLRIDWRGDRYEATETVMPVARIDSIYPAERTGFLGPREGDRATIDFRDVGQVKNYYLWDQFVNGRRFVAPDSTFPFRVVAADDGLDGRRVQNFQPYDGVVIKAGDTVLVRQMALSEPLYRYFLAIGDQAQGGGSPFSVPAGSVRGTVANRTRPEVRALGYFMATEVSEARMVVR